MVTNITYFNREETTEKILTAWKRVIALQNDFFKFQPHMIKMVADVKQMVSLAYLFLLAVRRFQAEAPSDDRHPEPRAQVSPRPFSPEERAISRKSTTASRTT
jgi:hypothetical protein